MDFRKFYWRSLASAAILATIFILFNVYMDEFGLFREVKGRSIAIPVSERASKYLLSLRYVPTNFDGILIGPSLSVQLDTGKLHTLNVYNLSLFGANANELKIMAENTIKKGKLKAVIICLDPYVFHDSSLKDTRMQPEMYRAALGSTFTLDYYNEKLSSHFNKSKPAFQFNDHGAANIIPFGDPHVAISAFANNIKKLPRLPIDPQAMEAMKELITFAHQHGVKVFAFYYPLPKEVYEAMNEKNYKEYQTKVGALFDKNDVVWDFNLEPYKYFGENYNNYNDHEHISIAGAEVLLKEIDKQLSEHL
jgi:hypothetical protein